MEPEYYRLPVSSPVLCFLASTMSNSSCLMFLPPEIGVVPRPCLSHYDKLSHLKIELKLFFLNLSLFQHSEEWDSELLALMWSVGELQLFTSGGGEVREPHTLSCTPVGLFFLINLA